LLDRLGLSEKSTVLPSKLSGGQKQRVAIARAMALQPKYLLADEPTGNLDSETGDAVMNLILSIKTSEQTVVLITHNERLSQYSDSIIRMKDGYIENAP
jgi:putative ABC transport system ATP-binding protein